MIRYQVRSEYGLSDPELYAPGEKDDPEALLEGVAMAGLVGVLRQLGDLAEFAAEIFHDLHEDVMATASRGHGLMLRLQQLEAEFPAVEKAIISQADHSNYPHDDGVEWHANIQLNQNMITRGDMPRFILDSYEECRGPPHLFTLDKFDVAGAGASLKRYSDPSLFKTEHASNMIETDGVREKKPRKIKKKAVRWRKGETLESLLVQNSESQNSSSKDRNSRKVPPRTTKLKPRHPRDSDHRAISRICREQLQEVISSQQKVLLNYSSRHYYAKFRSADSSETVSSFGELDNSNAPAQSSAKIERTKVVPVNEYDAVETASTLIKRSVCLDADDGQSMATQHGLAEVEDVCERSLVEKNGISATAKRLHESTDFKGEDSNCALQPVREEEDGLGVVPVDHDDDYCKPDDIGSDQDNFADALNIESEGEADHEMKTKWDLSANKLNCHSEEGENALHVQFSELDHAVDLSSGLKDSCNGGETTCADSFLVSCSSFSAASDGKYLDTDSTSVRELSGVNWTNDKEPFNDDDLMDVSSSSSVLSHDSGNNDYLNGCEQKQEAAFLSCNDYQADGTYNSDNQSPLTSSGLDGLANSYPEKAYSSVENGQTFVLDDTSMKFGQPNDVFHGDEETEVGDDDDLLLRRNIANQEQIQINEQLEEHTFLYASTSLGKLASLPDMGPVLHLNNLELDNVIFPEEEIVTNAMPTGLYPDDIHMHLDELGSGVAPIHSSIRNDPLYESHDDEFAEEWQCVRDEDLYKHAAEDQVGLEKRPCLTRVNTHNEDPTQVSVGPRHISTVREIPRVSESISPPQDDGEAHVGEILAPSPYVLNDETERLLIGGLAPSTASLLESSSSSVKHFESIDIEKIVKCGEVAEELATSRSEDDMMPCEQDCSVRAKYTEKAEVSATNCTKENSRHDVRMHSISPCREDLETVEATCANIGSLDESGEHIFNESMLQTDNFPQLTEIETSGETYSGGDDTRYVSSLHFPEESVWQEKIPEETSPHDLDKDGAVSLRSDMFGEQQSHVDQDSVTELSAQDSFSTNPFMDPGCTVSNTQTVSSPSMRYQPCLSEEEQDFLSEILINHGNTSAKEDPYPLADSLWESATPPDEAPLPSEVMTEEDFRSFCHEYNEMDFTAVTEGLDNKPSSDSNGITNGCVDNEVGFPSVSAPSAGLDQEVVCCNSDSQLAEGSSGTDIPGETLMPFSAKEDPDGETPVVDSDLYSHELSGNEKIPEVDRPSVPVELEQEQHSLPEVASHGGSYLLDNDKIGEIYGSSLGNVVPVKEEQEPCTNLTISEKLENLDVPPSNSQQVEPVVEGNGLDESCYQGMTCSSINDEIEELHVLSLSKPVPTQELEVCPLGELNAQIVPSSLIDKTTDDLEAPSLRTALEEKQDPEDGMSGEHDSQICASLVSEKTDELDTPPPSNVVLMENEPEVCAPCETDSHIASCSLRNEKIYELVGPPLSGSVLEKIESENHSSGDDSQITPSVNDKIDGLDAATSINDLQVEPEWETCARPVEWESCAPPVELGWEACASPAELEWEACSPPKLDSQIAPCSLHVDKFGQLDGPSSCNVRLESENGSDCSPEFDSHTTPCSSDSHVLAETLTVICTSVKPITEDNYRLSPVPPPIEPSPSVSYENPQKPPPLPPIQWRLGRPRLGLLNTEGHMPDPVKGTNPFLPASSQEVDYSSLNGTTGSIPAVSSQEIKESYQNPMVENSDQRVESGRSSTLPAVTDVVRTEHDRPLPEACENINHQRHTPSSSIETEQHLNVTGVTDGTALHQLNLSLPLSTYEHGMDQKGPQLHILYSDTADSSDHLRHTDPVACEDDKMMDGHNATDGVHSYAMTSSTPGQVSENGCYQHALNDDSFSETSDNKEHSSNESYEEKNLKDESMTNGAPSDTTEHTGPDSMLEERNSQESRNFQEQNAENPKNDQSKPSAKSMVSQDPHDDHIGRRDNVHHPSQIVLQPGDTNKYVGDLGEAEQPPVLGWTVGPQMLHPNYASMGAFEPEAADHRLTRKPISMRNIPRNPLVDAVAAHDRSTMRKVSDIAPATDEAKPKDRNLLLEQIRNKTFDLKPVGSAKPASVRASARASSRNLKVAAIIEKANAIRQAVGSDDEDEDNWSDT